MDKNRRKIWFGLALGTTILFIPICVNRLHFAYSVAAGNSALTLLESGVAEALVRTQAPRIGFTSSIFYFFGVLLPGYLPTL